MLEIKKEYKSGCVVYDFIGSIDNSDLEKVEAVLREDINHTYTFIFSFKHLNHINENAVKMLKKVYVMSVDLACEIVITGLHTQPAMMLEIFQVDKLYKAYKTVNMYWEEESESLYRA